MIRHLSRQVGKRLIRTRAASWSASLLVLALGSVPSTEPAPVALPALKIGVSLALTGSDARWGVPMLQGIQLAVEDANRAGTAGGHTLEVMPLDSAAPGQDTPMRQQAAVASYGRFIADSTVIAAIGPQSSPEGRAVIVTLSRANLATITSSATTFDLTDPASRGASRGGDRIVLFRTIGTDLQQAEAMARFAQSHVGVRRVALIEDGLESQGRLADVFERRAAALGVTVVARRLIGWVSQDYGAELRELAALKPDALYVAVRYAVGMKLARQIPAILPSVYLLGTDQLYNAALPIQARATRAEGWYVPHVAPDPAWSPAAVAWAERFRSRYGATPSGYALTAYAAVMVIADAVDRVVKRGQPVTRSRVRDAIETTRLLDTPAGPVSFGRNGDLERPAVSIYQIRSGAFEHVETMFAGEIKPPAPPRR